MRASALATRVSVLGLEGCETSFQLEPGLSPAFLLGPLAFVGPLTSVRLSLVVRVGEPTVVPAAIIGDVQETPIGDQPGVENPAEGCGERTFTQR